MSIALFPGSFDPITLGHVDIARRLVNIFDRVLVGVATNAGKSPAFSVSERFELATQVFAADEQIQVVAIDGLVATYAADHGVDVIVKGLRNGADFDGELPMGLMNRAVGGVETLFIPGSQRYAHIASSLVKDIARYGGDVSEFVPAAVVQAFRAKERKQ